jgi:hypothetical protein
MNSMNAKRWLAVLLAIGFINCSWSSRRVKLGEQFTMRPKDKVSVASTQLTIRLDEVGHQTFSGPTSGRAGYVELFVTSQTVSKSIRLSAGDAADIDGYVITVNSALPFSSQGGPGCELMVAKKQ